jgi:hypothetical protein|tara:strand:+ start:5446 stop:5664 length:219 start_codon:yes stop_codon:yes gene_type:complete
MNKEDWLIWKEFRLSKKPTISDAEFRTICRIHSDNFNHSYFEPCRCSPKRIVQWIEAINKLFLESKKYRVRK